MLWVLLCIILLFLIMVSVFVFIDLLLHNCLRFLHLLSSSLYHSAINYFFHLGASETKACVALPHSLRLLQLGLIFLAAMGW